MTTFSSVRNPTVAAIREQLNHPIIDADGHLTEFMPLVRDYVREVGGADLAESFHQLTRNVWQSGKGFRPVRVFNGLPAKNTLDRMTSTLPELLYARLDEIGIDFALLYPSFGLLAMYHPDAEMRQVTARALNRYCAENFEGFRDRLEPVAVIPMFTPEEAISELDYAVGDLGLKCAVMSGVIPRFESRDGREEPWVDTLGHESLYDYDPVWSKCMDLGVVPAFHGIGYGWGSRISATNYVYNHLGNFGAAQEAVLRSLVIGGVPRRFPDLRMTFLEGGVSWACQLFADLLSHFEKRNKEAVTAFDDRFLDIDLATDLFATYGHGPMSGMASRFERSARRAATAPDHPAGYDDFAESLINGPGDIVDMFSRQFYFGCEADDPLNSLAFRRDLVPQGIRLNAVFASDIGHWDVTNVRDVLPEAWELVEHEQISRQDFFEFSCGSVARMLTSMNPDFFKGTVVADRPLTE